MPVFSAQGAASVEVYGFTGWITTGVAYGAFLCWAYLPEQALQAVGITYYPDKYWALAVPTWVCVAIVAAAWAYESWNASLVLPLESIRNLQDSHSKSPSSLGMPSIIQDCTRSVPPLADADPLIMSKVLYGGYSLIEAERIGNCT